MLTKNWKSRVLMLAKGAAAKAFPGKMVSELLPLQLFDSGSD